MRLGGLRCQVISDGRCKFDAGVMFGIVPRALWTRRAKPDRRNRLSFGLNCLLIRTPRRNILVDNGVGPKEPPQTKALFGLGPSRLLRGLKAVGLGPGDINTVVLTHLHWDHAGGSTYLDRKSGETIPTFPRATYLVQRASWEEATHANERNTAGYHRDDFMPVFERGLVKLLDGDEEVAPGVDALVTGGHAPGHQVVTVTQGDQRLCFLGDLIPSHLHLPLPYVSAYDEFPLASLDYRRQLLERAARERWLLIFQHDLGQLCGTVTAGPRGYQFTPSEWGED